MPKLISLPFAVLAMAFWSIPQLARCQDNGRFQKQFSFRELTVAQGLSQNSVVSIAQDSIGFMWFATQDGLNRYDGTRFYQYSKQFEDVTRPTYSRLGEVFVDKAGQLFIIPITGRLERYNPITDSFSPISSIENASTVIQDKNDHYYIGTYGDGLYVTDLSENEPIKVASAALGALHFYDSMELNDRLLFSTSEGLLEVTETTHSFIPIEGFENTAFSALAQNKQGVVFAGTYGKGLFIKLENSNQYTLFHGFEEAPFSSNLNILDLEIDHRDRLWVATYGDGAYLIDFKRETIRHFVANKTNPYALHYNDVLSLYEDFTNTMWLGTDGAGLSYYDEHLVKFNVLTNKQLPISIQVDVTRAIAANEKTIWLGTSGKGLSRLQLSQQNFKTFTKDNSDLAGDRVMSLSYDTNGLWIGHQNKGLQYLTKSGTFKDFPETNGLTIWKIYKTANDSLWLCTRSQGLILFDPQLGIKKSFNRQNSTLTTNNIRTIEQGKGSIIWIGTEDKGLFKLDIQTNIITKIDAVSVPIKSLYYTSNKLWVGTNGKGLILYNLIDESVRAFTRENGLPNNVIYGILPDDKGNLWLSSNQGLSNFTIDGEYYATIENYTDYDGLQALEYNTGAYFKDDKGTLYFGGLDGINWFHPEQLSFNPVIPKTIITGLEVFNTERELLPGQQFDHNENTITFTFASLHYSQPERNKFKYKLSNNDTDWILANNTNVAHYTNLPPNEYTFQVISSNYDGIWNETPTAYSFTIAQPWYATNLAKVIYLILFLWLLYGIYAYLKWRWNVQNQLLKDHEETERLKKLDEFKTNLYTNISHEIRTPLTLISGPVENQLKRDELTEKDKKDLTLIKQNSNRLIHLVNQMLDLSLTDSGSIKLKIEQGNLELFLKQIINTFRYAAKDKRIEFEYEFDNLKNCWFDRDVVEKIVTNLVNNAIKYAVENTTITMQAKKDQDWFVFAITNKKDGRNVGQINQLFNRFYQADESSEGIGVGLALVKELANLHNGNIIAHASGDNSIQFTVTLPVVKEAFNEEDVIKQRSNVSEEIIQNSASDNKNTETLLIVEDNMEVREYIVSVFTLKYNILEAENGKAGIELAIEHLPHLIISDIVMPIKSGIELCDTIKTNELTSHIPVILLTAKVGEEAEIQGLQTGADAYITKPFSVEKLKVRVQQLLETRKKVEAHFSKTFTIDPNLGITSTETEFLKRMQSVLDTHITDPELTSEKFADLMNISRTQLHRKLKSIVGKSTSSFIRSHRLRLAAGLLKESDNTTSEIAYTVGFNSPSYFARCFKEAYGYTPSEFASKEV
ncbi:MAG: response regulator [Flavobacteriales bacterium]|nr:response regulator [Flavobacteriales bacterium]